MKTILYLTIGHVLAITALFGIGVAINDRIILWSHDYQGGITVVSIAFGIYSFACNFLYQWNREFHIWINRLLLSFSRTHTYWQLAFDYELDPRYDITRDQLLDMLQRELDRNDLGAVRTIQRTPTTIDLSFDDVVCVVFRVDEMHLHVGLDRRILVPSHLYDSYRVRFSRMAELLQNAIKPRTARYAVTVSFGDGITNPYYGFFVNRLPASLLNHFEVSFQLDNNPSSRIEAGTDHLNIESNSLVGLFNALTEVLALRAVPKGAK